LTQLTYPDFKMAERFSQSFELFGLWYSAFESKAKQILGTKTSSYTTITL